MSEPRTVRIAPSILTADFGRLAEAVRAADDGGADLFHLDVMDGHFVPELTFGPLIVGAVRKATRLPIEVHLMVARPREQFAPLAEAGAQTLLFHVEATDDPAALLAEARAQGCAAGLAISPETPADAVRSLLPSLDEVIVMLVHPGRGGQQMLSEHLEKVRQLRGWIDEGGFDVALEVDGGVKTHNAASCVEAGVDIIVAGSAVYNDRETPQRSLAALRGAISVAQAP